MLQIVHVLRSLVFLTLLMTLAVSKEANIDMIAAGFAGAWHEAVHRRAGAGSGDTVSRISAIISGRFCRR